MSGATESAILAGGCFWGMQDLIRKRPGVISTRVGYTGGDVANATYRNHGTHAEAIEIIVRSRADQLPRPARVLLPDPRSDDAEPPGQRRRHELPLGDLLSRRRAAPRRRGHDRRRRGVGPLARARSSPRCARPVRSGRPSPSTRTTCERYPNGYTCHFPRPGWVLPKRNRVRHRVGGRSDALSDPPRRRPRTAGRRAARTIAPTSARSPAARRSPSPRRRG